MRALLATTAAILLLASEANAQETPAPEKKEAAPTEAAPASEAPAKHTAGPWIMISAGAALVVVAGVFGGLTVSEDKKAESDEIKAFSETDPARRKQYTDSAASHEAAGDRNRLIAIVTGTVGFLSIGGAVLWWFAEGGSSSAKHLPRPALGPGYAGASWGVSF
ncbi:MAG: hypothetical protein KF819_01780 [Labilithrix sp.]|nr:hypothetical protein [Labilithrix sp.]